MATKIEEALAALTTEVRLANQRWEEQGRVNTIVLEHQRALHGENGDEGMIGRCATRGAQCSGRLLAVEKAQAQHEDEGKWAFRAAVGSFLLFLGGCATAAFNWLFHK